MNKNDSNAEDRALDALMVAAFLLSSDDETTDVEKAEHLAAIPPHLSKEDEAVIESLGDDFVKNVICRKKRKNERSQERISEDIKEALAAMNRGKTEEDLSEKTRKEIERKRRELLVDECKEEDNGS